MNILQPFFLGDGKLGDVHFLQDSSIGETPKTEDEWGMSEFKTLTKTFLPTMGEQLCHLLSLFSFLTRKN